MTYGTNMESWLMVDGAVIGNMRSIMGVPSQMTFGGVYNAQGI